MRPLDEGCGNCSDDALLSCVVTLLSDAQRSSRDGLWIKAGSSLGPFSLFISSSSFRVLAVHRKGALRLTHRANHFRISLTMDSIIFYQPPLNTLGSSTAASRFPACREAAIVPHRIPRPGITLGGERRGPAATTDIPRTDRPKHTADAKRDTGTFPKHVAEHILFASSGGYI